MSSPWASGWRTAAAAHCLYLVRMPSTRLCNQFCKSSDRDGHLVIIEACISIGVWVFFRCAGFTWSVVTTSLLLSQEQSSVSASKPSNLKVPFLTSTDCRTTRCGKVEELLGDGQIEAIWHHIHPVNLVTSAVLYYLIYSLYSKLSGIFQSFSILLMVITWPIRTSSHSTTELQWHMYGQLCCLCTYRGIPVRQQ